jgi:phage shock protein PspC (stress-responsive transcriptional regulator)
MDAAINGLIGGSTVSMLLVIGGLVTYYKTGFGEYFRANPNVTATWLVFLTALTVGQIVLVGYMVQTLMSAPVQTRTATVE